MRMLLTGKNGQVGFELQRALAPLGEIVAVDQTECNLADRNALRALVQATRPDIIINPAAYTAVDKAESEPDLASAINGAAPGILGEEAAKIGALVVHYCTDYVFDGTKQTPYTEEDTPSPLSVYGRSKAVGTQALCRQTPYHLVFRTSWVYSGHGNNFVKTMLRLAGERESLNVVADQFGAPTSAALIADVTAQIIGQYRRTDRPFPFGLYNLVAAGETSWCGFARAIVGAAHQAGRPLQLKPANIHPISTAEYPLPAPRPANSRLATGKLEQTFALRMPSWQEGLTHVLQQLF